MSTGAPLPLLSVTTTRGGRAEQDRLTIRARQLTYIGLAWHALEAAVAIAAGVIAGSVALIGFGADSVIEAAAGLVVLWLVTGWRLSSGPAERQAQKLIAGSFVMLAVYIAIESARDLIGGQHPAVSWLGGGLAVAARDDSTRRREATGRRRARLLSGGKREPPDDALRLPLRRTPARSPCQRGRGLVVGRPSSRAAHRGSRTPRSPRRLARSELHLLPAPVIGTSCGAALSERAATSKQRSRNPREGSDLLAKSTTGTGSARQPSDREAAGSLQSAHCGANGGGKEMRVLTTEQERQELTIRAVILVQSRTTPRKCSGWASDDLLDVALDDLLELVEALQSRRLQRAAGQERG
jgi:hypothetical protein